MRLFILIRQRHEQVSSHAQNVGSTHQKYGNLQEVDTFEDSVYHEDELELLDKHSIPKPKTNEDLNRIQAAFHNSLHGEIIVCAVCDQFCRASSSSLIEAKSLPFPFLQNQQEP